MAWTRRDERDLQYAKSRVKYLENKKNRGAGCGCLTIIGIVIIVAVAVYGVGGDKVSSMLDKNKGSSESQTTQPAPPRTNSITSDPTVKQLAPNPMDSVDTRRSGQTILESSGNIKFDSSQKR